MKPLVIEVKIPGHIPNNAPDHQAVGKKLDALLKKHFLGKEIIVRCIGSQDHPGTSLDDLTNLVATTGTTNMTLRVWASVTKILYAGAYK